MSFEGCEIPRFRLIEVPLDERWVEVVGPDGRCLVVMPDEEFHRKVLRGAWQYGAQIRTYFLTAAGRRGTLARWDWTKSELARQREGGPEPSIRIMPDYAGAYAWDQYGRWVELVDVLGESPKVAALDAALAAWQCEWGDSAGPFAPEDDPPPPPPGDWDAWAERGLERSRRSLALMGPEGVVINRCPPSRFGCSELGLVLYLERQVGVN